MTRIKLCGLSRLCDIEAANALQPDYIGFVFAKKSPRCVSPEKAKEFRRSLRPDCKAVGVFVNEAPEAVRDLLQEGIIDLAQLHGREDEDYIRRLRQLTGKPLVKAFSIRSGQDILEAQKSSADYVLLDAGEGGTGITFDWRLIQELHRPYFLAGGLDSSNVTEAIRLLHPYAVDVSSGIETDGYKDQEKMKRFVAAVRSAEA